ncbi:glycoside hydrolase family 43 protein [Paenibacillus sp. NEAU-GSW1]|uniref:glycoside hydrolase family 43 protein n=1 Tax=Paenibacillus sp. NEAU-GSW1 TaxID=2682486 RepID=UPI0012E0FB55|nr:glycoside hydrolase family 43 protein [Paenibacillus sp. NEAU-GSW1]MUT67492.1 family 43 glycosylhydrolase [Paenibacillus sp. NEAU-GSW1]
MKTRMKYRNPVLPGFYPDPSAIRVGDDYYLATSTFEYFPGVPLFHSKDLVSWKQIGNVLTRSSQVDMLSRKSSEGIYAPVLRHHEGVFYLITTDVYGIGNFYVTAADPAGPWSDPIRIPYGNIDPSLFFDEDGKVYVSAQSGFGETSHIIQYEIDIETGAALTEPVVVWEGDEGPWVEGPHLYKINGLYYMMTASGGTGPQHREIIGRSESPYGPFEMLPHPILTHNRLSDHPIQYTGHVELIDDSAGNWWALFLGVRPRNANGSVLGRETFLAPVQWVDGWPMIDNNEGHVGLEMEVELEHAAWDCGAAQVEESLESSRVAADSHVYTDFASLQLLGPEWLYTRVLPSADAVRLSEDGLTLIGNRHTLRDGASNVFVCRRQQHHEMRIETKLSFAPVSDGEYAGLAARLSDGAYCAIGLKRREGALGIASAIVRKGETEEQFVALEAAGYGDGAGEAQLAIRSNEEEYELLYSLDGEHWLSAGAASADGLTPDSEGAFTGVCVGMFVNGTPEEENQSAPAHFRYFDYQGTED